MTRPQREQLLDNVLDHFKMDREKKSEALSLFAAREPYAMQLLQHRVGLRIVVVQKRLRGKIKLIFDGRHALWDASQDAKLPLRCYLLSRNNKLLMEADNVERFPQLQCDNFVANMYKKAQPLWQLLKYQPLEHENLPPSSPQTLPDLKDYVDRYASAHCKVVVKFKCSAQKDGPLIPWFENPAPSDVQDVLYLVAVTDRFYHLQYLPEPEPDDAAARRRGEKTVRDYQRFQELWEQLDNPDETMTDPYQPNCAAAVNVQHNGLNLLHDLGWTTVEERNHLSQQLHSTCSSLFVFVDEQHHLRHITYYDREQSFCAEVPCFEHDNVACDAMTDKEYDFNEKCRSEASQVMLDFWQKVWQRRTYWVDQRKTILQPWLDRFQTLLAFPTGSTLASPLLRCFKELKKMAYMHHILMYSKEDGHMHAIKFYLSHFAYKTFKHCRGIAIKAQSDDTLAKLSIPGMTVANAFVFFDCKCDSVFFSSLWKPWNGPLPSDVIISHNVKHLDKQKMDSGQCTLMGFCRQRGALLARHIWLNWLQFGQFLLATFGYELFGQTTLPSASYLAFQCVWTLYHQKAGPLVQAPERCKPYYEDLLRESSRGGFMFSAETFLAQGDELFPTTTGHGNATLADAIVEYDLISAYGFSAATSHLPSGFCTGFQRMSSSPSNDDGNHRVMEKLDQRARHASFEFRAVYKTILQLMNQGVAIRTLYHNYSPMGVFTLGKYNLDLVVVTETGSCLLYNMDGHWAHSCPQCPVTKSHFIGGQTHQQVRQKAVRRDADIQAWVDGINAGENPPRAHYVVVHDCHSPGYLTGTLEWMFQHDPTLAALTRGYDIVNACGSFLTPSSFSQLVARHPEPDYTFIAKAKVRVEPDATMTNPHVGPLVVYTRKESPTDFNSEGGAAAPMPDKRSRQQLGWQGTVVLTRDYHQWLDTTFGERFQLEQLDWVLFFKTEPVLNDIYHHLIQLRANTTNQALVSFLKRLINLSCGFFGAHASQRNKTTYRLVNKMPKNYAFFRHHADIQRGVDLDDDTYFLLETKPWPKIPQKRSPSKSALPMFLTVVEAGKLRLIQLFHFLWSHLCPDRYRLLYSNIDNVILALAGPDLKSIVQSDRIQDFEAQVDSFFVESDSKPKTPGLAELKWKRYGPESQWQFITIRIQHYCLKAAQTEDSLHKTSGWSNISSDRAFDSALNILYGRGAVIPQIRRIKKMEGMSTHTVLLHH